MIRQPRAVWVVVGMAWSAAITISVLTTVQDGRHFCTGLLTQLANVRIGDNRKLAGGISIRLLLP
eukprot:1172083-Prorocentrum_lima.AAC.1